MFTTNAEFNGYSSQFTQVGYCILLTYSLLFGGEVSCSSQVTLQLRKFFGKFLQTNTKKACKCW